MARDKLPVIAAIPAHNEERLVGGLLNQVLEQEYDSVYVLDDASTDNTLEVAYSFGKDVRVETGTENLGSAGNRNRIIGKVGKSIIHFIDADMRINSDRTPEIIQDLLPTDTESIGYIGGLIRNPDNQQMPWNYGPAFSLPQVVSSWLYAGVHELGRTEPELAQVIRNTADHWSLVEQWPNTLEEPKPKEVYWSAEANLVASSEIFSRMGGYNQRMRYHEILEYSRRLAAIGLKRFFDPAIDATHQESLDSLNKKAISIEAFKAMAIMVGQMGLREFLSPKEI